MTSFVAAVISDNAGPAIVAVVARSSSRLRRGRADFGRNPEGITWHRD